MTSNERNRQPEPEAPVQDTLPFEFDFTAGPVELDSLPGYIACQTAAEELRQDVHTLIGAVPEFAGRWALRLGLPVAGAWVALHIPYNTKVDGIPLQVQGSLFSGPGLSANTSLGNWEFRNVDALPVGVHVSVQNVNGLEVAQAANTDPKAYAKKFEKDLRGEVPTITTILGAELLGGAVAGAVIGAGINGVVRHYKGLPRREHELRHRSLQGLALVGATAMTAGVGAVTWNPEWQHDYKLTGTLAEMQGLNNNLAEFYSNSKAYDVTRAILAIQTSLQEKIDEKLPTPAFNVMHISDMHLFNNYPLVEQYAEAYGVKLIINTGDESEFGTAQEMTADYIASIKQLTEKVPMIWIAGNHDSPDTVEAMKKIPGVIVLGSKKQLPDGSFTVGAKKVNVYGLNIGGIPDPRVYGGEGAYGSNDGPVTNKLETSAVDKALKGIASGHEYYDDFLGHEPAAIAEIIRLLKANLRQVNYGHEHEENKDKDIQSGTVIKLQEGSTGEGGIDHINSKATPAQFSIESYAGNCQATKVLRFSLSNGADGQTTTIVDTVYLRPQKIAAKRVCNVTLGIGPVQDILPGLDGSAQAAGPHK